MKFIGGCLARAKDYWDSHLFVPTMVVFVLVFALYSSIFFTTPGFSASDDQLFHFKFASLIRTEGWSAVEDFKWRYFYNPTGNEEDRYPVSLFQLVLIPFTISDDLATGLKWSDIFWGSLVVALFYLLFRKLRIRFPFLFILLLVSSSYFSGRIIMGRPLVLIIFLVFGEIFLALKKRHWGFFAVSLLHILWHSSTFFVPLMVAGIAEVARYLDSRKFFWKNVIGSVLAFVLGMAFFPDFPRNLWSWGRAIFSTQWAASVGDLKGEGAELYAKDPLNMLIGNYEIFFLLSVISACLVIYFYITKRGGSESSRPSEGLMDENLTMAYAVFIFLIIVILGSITVSGRLYDFYAPSVVFLSALLFSRIAPEPSREIENLAFRPIVFGVFFFLILFNLHVFIGLKSSIYRTDLEPTRQAAEWLASQTAEGELVYLYNWSLFPAAFFYNSHNVYSMGMEPRELLDYDPKLYWKWYNMFHYVYYCDQEKDCGDEMTAETDRLKDLSQEERDAWFRENGRRVVHSIKNDFGSRAVLSESEQFSRVILVNEELVAEKFEAKSEINGSTIRAFILK